MKTQTALNRAATQVTDQAVQTIHDRIQQGRYPISSSLPAQRELAQNLGISRASLREALTRLAALGIVEIKAGKGVYVLAQQSQPVSQWNMHHNISLKDFYQLRYILEGFSALLACEYLSNQDIAVLQENFKQMSNAIAKQDWQLAAHYDFEFHHLIIELSHNQSVIQALKQQRQWLQQSQILPFVQVNLAHKTVSEHQSILNALCARDGIAAEQAMQKHIISAARRAGVFFISHLL